MSRPLLYKCNYNVADLVLIPLYRVSKPNFIVEVSNIDVSFLFNNNLIQVRMSCFIRSFSLDSRKFQIPISLTLWFRIRRSGNSSSSSQLTENQHILIFCRFNIHDTQSNEPRANYCLIISCGFDVIENENSMFLKVGSSTRKLIPVRPESRISVFSLLANIKSEPLSVPERTKKTKKERKILNLNK